MLPVQMSNTDLVTAAPTEVSHQPPDASSYLTSNGFPGFAAGAEDETSPYFAYFA